MTKSFLILYASVTGKAESIAQLIHRDSESKGFQSTLVCLSELDKVCFSTTSNHNSQFSVVKAVVFLKKIAFYCQIEDNQKSLCQMNSWTK
jgi:hypothetical protein